MLQEKRERPKWSDDSHQGIIILRTIPIPLTAAQLPLTTPARLQSLEEATWSLKLLQLFLTGTSKFHRLLNEESYLKTLPSKQR